MLKQPKRVFMFSGQGSQYYNMGYALYQDNPIFRKTMNDLDELVISISGYSVISTIFDENKLLTDNLDILRITHPAIFMVQYAMVQALKSFNVHPDIVLGYSLGEYCALVTAGVISPEEAIRIILSQAKTVVDVCQPGFMYAILGDHKADLPSYLNITQIELAAINFSHHFVLAGPQAAEQKLVEHLEAISAVYFKLPIQYGFHSGAIEDAIEPIMASLSTTQFSSPKLPLVSCTAKNYVDSVNSTYFSKILRSTLYFQEVLDLLENQGQYQYLDVGPSDTLSTFVKYNLKAQSLSQIIPTIRLTKQNYNTDDLMVDLAKL